MPAIGAGLREGPTRKAKPKPRRTPPRANVYVPPAALAPKVERKAAKTTPNRYTPPERKSTFKIGGGDVSKVGGGDFPTKKTAHHHGVLGALALVGHELKSELVGRGVGAKGVGYLADQIGRNADRIVNSIEAAPYGPQRAPARTRQATELPAHATTIIGKTAKDLVNAPAQVIPSLYIPAASTLETLRGRPQRGKKFVKDLKSTDPFYNAAAAGVFKAAGNDHAANKHWKTAKKQALEHPGFTALEGTGIAGGLDRLAGSGVRGAARVTGSQTLRDYASTARQPKTLPGTSLVEHRRYSKRLVQGRRQRGRDKRAEQTSQDFLDAAAKEKNPEKRSELQAKARNASPHILRDRDIATRVDEHVDRVEQVRRLNRAKVLTAERQASKPLRTRAGRPKVGAPIANLLVQGITRPTINSLSSYLKDLEHAHGQMKGEKSPPRARMKANEQLRHDLEKAIEGVKSGKVDLTEIANIAKEYSGRSVLSQAGLVARGMVGAGQAERARLTPFAVRELGAHHDQPYLAEQARVAQKAATRAKGQVKRASRRVRAAKSQQPFGPLTKEAVTLIAKRQAVLEGKKKGFKEAKAKARGARKLARPGMDPLLRVRTREVEAVAAKPGKRKLTGEKKITGTASKGHVVQEGDPDLTAAYHGVSDPKTGAKLANVIVHDFDMETIGRNPDGSRITQPKKYTVRADVVVGGKKVGKVSRIYDRATGALVKESTHIEPEFQRKGIASGLARAEERALTEAGVRKVQTVPTSEAGKALTKRLGGFKPVEGAPGRVEKSLTQASEKPSEVADITVKTGSKTLLHELQYRHEVLRDTPGDDYQHAAESVRAALEGRPMTRAQATEVRAQLANELGEGGRWNPAHDWGGTGEPMPQVRKAAQTMLKRLDEALRKPEKPKEPGPSADVLEQRLAGHEAALKRQQDAGVNEGRGNMDTIAARNQARKALDEARAGQPTAQIDPKAAADLKDAHDRLAELENEHHDARNAKLTDAQREALDTVSKPPAERADVPRTTTIKALIERGLVDGEPVQGSYHITEKGKGVLDPHLVAGDIQAQRQYIARLEDEAQTAARTAAETPKPATKPTAKPATAKPTDAGPITMAIRTYGRTKGKAAVPAHTVTDKVPLSTEEMQAAASAAGIHPGFLSQSPTARGAINFFRSSGKAPRATGYRRGGEATTQGTFDAHPDLMHEQMARTQGLIDAFEHFQEFLDEFGLRKPGDKKILNKKSKKEIDEIVRNENAKSDVEWTAVRVNPFGASKAQLEAMLEGTEPHGPMHEQVMRALDPNTAGAGSGDWAIVPKAAADRMNAHLRQLGGGNLTHLGRGLNQVFRKTVLATSLPWLVGNTAEAAIRAGVAHAGPRSYFTGRRVLKAARAIDPERAKLAEASTIGGGHYGFADRSQVYTTFDQLKDSRIKDLARPIAAFVRAPGARHAVGAWNGLTHITMKMVNKTIEQRFQTALLGKAIRQDLMTDGLRKASDEATQKAAQGLLDRNTAVHLGREIDKMYGKYSKFDPELRKAIALYTPFVAWTINSLHFLTQTLPRDHPVLTATIASVERASEEWRKEHGLDMFTDGSVPLWLQGSIPGPGGSSYRVSRFTPFGIGGDPLGTISGQVLPQVMSMILAGKGLDWKGQPLVEKGEPGVGREALAVGQSFLEGFVPAVGLGLRIKKKGAKAAILDAAIGKTTPAKPKTTGVTGSGFKSGFSSGFGGSGFSSSGF